MELVSCCECRKAGYYGPFVVPGSRLFLDFCNSLVDPYGLKALVSRGTVEGIRIIGNKEILVDLKLVSVMVNSNATPCIPPTPIHGW